MDSRLGVWAALLGLTAAGCGLTSGTSTDGRDQIDDDIQAAIDLAEKDIADIALDEVLPPTAPPSTGEPVPGGTSVGASDAEGGSGDIVVDGVGGTLCDEVPGQAVTAALGGPPEQATGVADTCTWTRTTGSTAAVISLSLSPTGGGLDLAGIVQTVAASVDADGVAESVDEVGDEAYVMAGDLGTYLYATAGDDLIVVFTTAVPDAVQAATTIARAMTVR